MVALSVTKTLNAQLLAKNIKKLFPELSDQVGKPVVEEQELPAFTLPVGDSTVIVLNMPVAIPKETLSRAIGDELIWKTASKAFSKTQSHVLITLLQPQTETKQALPMAKLLTAVVAGCIKTSKAVGVYWSLADYVIEPERFLSEATQSVSEDPYDLWVTQRFYPGETYNQDQRIVCRTSGLSPFTGRELECGPVEMAPGDLAGMLRGIGRYIVSSNTQFEDGATLSDGDHYIGELQYQRSRYGGDEKPVLHLKLGA